MKKAFLLIFLYLVFAGNARSQTTVSLSGYPIVTTGWVIGGVATTVDSTIRLTPSVTGEIGYVYYNTALDVTACGQFSVDFDFKINSAAGCGFGDGIAFFLINPMTSFVGGGGLGLPSPLTGVVLTMDTWDNDGDGLNPEDELMGYPSASTYAEGDATHHLAPILGHQTYIDDGSWHHVRMTYNGGTIRVYMNGATSPSMTGTFPITTSDYFGFSAGTGCAYSVQSIKSVNISYNTISAILGTTTICQGSTSALSDSTSGGTWSSSNTSVATVVPGTGVVTAVTTGTSVITYSYNSGACTATTTVNVVPPPTAIAGVFNICVGTGTTLTDGTSGGTWSSSNTSVATIGSGSGTVSGVSAGTTVITYSTGPSCYVTTTVNVITVPTAITGVLTVCTGATTSLGDATAGGTWSSSATATATVGATGTTGGILPGTSTITYSVGGTCAISAVVTVNASPAAITGPSAVCSGFTITLADSISGGTWSSGSTGIATVVPGTGVVTGVSTAGGAVVIKYTAPGGCMATKTITVHPLPGFISGASGVCVGSCTPLFDGGTGTWTSNDTTIARVGLTTGMVCGVSAGTAIITYTLPTGCWITTSITITGLPPAITGTAIVCPGATTVLSDVVIGGTWTSASTGIATVDLISGVVSGVTSGTSVISYTAGCTITDTITVSPPPPAISAAPALCAGDTITLTDLSGGTWGSSDATVATIGTTTGLVTGAAVTITSAATITYTSPSGCTTTETIEVNPLPPPVTGTMHVCVGQTTILNDGLPGGAWTSANIGIATVSSPGVGSSIGIVGGVAIGADTITYTLSLTGCATHAIVTVNAAPGPVSGVHSACIGTTISLTDTSAGGTWTSSSTSIATVGSTGIVTCVTSGTITITYSFGGTCSVTFLITVNPLPAAIAGTTHVCAGLTTTLTDPAGPGTWTSSNTAVAIIGPTSGTVTGETAGTTTIIYTPPTGCPRTTAVTVNPLPAIIRGDSSICSGGTTTLSDSTAGGTWSSSASGTAAIGSTTGIVTGGTAGSATITYKITATGCLMTDIVTVNPLPALFTITGGGGYCAGGTGVPIGISGSAAGISYVLSTGGASVGPVLTGTGGPLSFGVFSTAGIYTVTATNISTSCSRAMTGSVTITINPIPTISGATAVCVGADIILTASPTGGTWTSSNTANATVGATSGVVGGITTGTSVVITYTSPAGCIATTTVNVSPSPGPITGPASVCVGSSVTETDAITGGLWTSSSTATATVGSFSGSVTGLIPTTTLIITYSLGTGCTVTRVMTVTPAPGVISGLTSVCSGATITLSDPTTPGGTWSSSATGVATVNATTGVVLGGTAGTAVITYTLGGCTATTTVTVNFAPLPLSGPATVCAGLTITLIDGITGGAWTSSNTAAPISSTGVITGTDPGGTSVITYSLGGTCVATKTITVNPISPISGATGICVGATTTLGEATACGTWTSSVPGNASIGGSSGLVTGLISGTSTVITFTSCAGCIATTTVNVSPSPVAISGPSAVCTGASVTEGDAVTGGLWSSSSTSVATVGSSSGTVYGLVPGATVITYSLGGSCTKTATVSVTPPPSVTISTAHVCSGSTATIGAASPAGGTWSSSNTGIATINSTSGAVTGETPGLDTVTYIAGTGCGKNITITINPLPSPISGTTSLCEGTTTDLSDGTPGGTWSSSNSAVASVGTSSGVVTGGAIAGTATIIYTIGTGCTVSVTVTVIAPPPAITGATSVCAGLTATLTDPTTGGAWSSENTAIAIIGTGTGIVTGITSGTVIISYTVGTGCTRISTIIVNPLSPITGDSMVCAGQTITLTDTTEDGSWTTSASSVALVVTATATTGTVSGISVTGGTATITYTLPTGCAATRTVTVNPGPSAIAGVSSVCAGSTTTLSDASPFGVWSSGNTAIATITPGGVLTGITEGTVMISYTLAGTGCPAITAIAVNPLPDPIGGPADVCAGSMVTLTDPGGGTWSCTPTAIATIGSTGIVSGVSPGTAFITYTLPTTCATTTSINVDSIPAPITGNPLVCVGATTTLSDATLTGSWSSSNSSDAPVDPFGVVTGLTAGPYVITFTTASGCAATKPITVDPIPGAIMGATTLCQGATTILTDATSGGTWMSDNTAIATIDSVTGHLLGTGAGSAGITYTTGAGCIATTTEFINPAPDPIMGSAAICDNTVAGLTDGTGGGAWTSSNTSVATVDGSGNVSGFALGTSAISYTVAGCPAILNVTINPLPDSIAGPVQVCQGSAIILSDAVTGGSWSSSNTAVATINIATGVVTGLSPGPAVMTYSLGAGCTTFTTIIVNGIPDPIGPPGVNDVCAGGSRALFDNPAGGTWSSGSTGVATVDPSAGVVYGVSAGAAGITYTLSTGCYMSTIISVNPAPVAIAGSPNVCIGTSHMLTDAVPGGTWSSSSTTIATIDSLSGMVSGLVLGTATIDYVIGACVASKAVTVDPLPAVFNVTGGASYCEGGTGVPVGLDGSVTGVNYILYLGATATGTFAGTGSALNFGLQTVAGSYTVTAISTVTTCSNTMSGSALVTIMPSVPPSVSISANPGDTVCSGTSTTFTAVPVYGGSFPAYQWSVNGTNVSTSPTYTFIPASGDIVAVALTSNGLCAMPTVVTHSVTMTVNPFHRPGVSINLTPGDTVCAGSPVTLTAVPAYGGLTPVYIWVKNGTTGGATGGTYAYAPGAGDSLRCIMVSDYPCLLGGDTVSSVEVILNVDTIQLPVVSINASPGTNVGNGQYDTLTAIVANGGVFPTYQWFVNGYPVAGATGSSYVSDSFELTREDSVSCMVTSDAVCPATSFMWVYINASNVGVKTVSGQSGEVVVVPNPNKGEFIVKGTLGTTDQQVSLELTNMLGQVVYSNKVMAPNGRINEHVQLSKNIANGMYMLSLHSDSENKVFHIVIEQ